MFDDRLQTRSRTGISRRLVLLGGAGLTIASIVPLGGRAQETDPPTHERETDPHVFIRIGTDGTVSVLSKHLEFGQGVYTGLATLVAEELDAVWDQIEAVAAPADGALYNNLLFGPFQGTGGSTSMMNAHMQMREAGATARALVIAAAAQDWDVPAAEISVESGIVRHDATGRTSGFGPFAEAAAQLPLPDLIRLKDPTEFRIVGQDVPRLDQIEKTDGSAIYTQDIQLPGMLVATLARPERAGQRLADYDREAALAVRGVRQVVETEYGIAVLGEHSWAAIAGRQALEVTWEDTTDDHFDSTAFQADLVRMTEASGMTARADPGADTAWDDVARVIDLPVSTPFLAHVPMEPPNYVMQRTADGIEIWAGEQWQTGHQNALSRYFDIPVEQIRMNMLYAGGSFGRRGLSAPLRGFVGETAAIVNALGDDTPVKLIYTREDDVTGGWYRPAFCDRIRAGLDADGTLRAWEHRVAGPSIARNTDMEPLYTANGFDEFNAEGATTTPYAFPAYRVGVHEPEVPFDVLWHRSSSYFGATLATETGLEAVARETGQDRLALRRSLLSNQPRILAVLDAVVDQSGWERPLPQAEGWRVGRGVAVGLGKGTTPFAMVTTIRIDADNAFRIDRIDCAIDCGIAINPDVVRSQVDGGACFGLGMTLHGDITYIEGRVDQQNFDGFRLLEMAEAPPVNITIVPSVESPLGVGEMATPFVAPSLMNAIWDATGERPDVLPLTKGGYRYAMSA